MHNGTKDDFLNNYTRITENNTHLVFDVSTALRLRSSEMTVYRHLLLSVTVTADTVQEFKGTDPRLPRTPLSR